MVNFMWLSPHLRANTHAHNAGIKKCYIHSRPRLCLIFCTLLGVESVPDVRWNQRMQELEKTSDVIEQCSTDMGAGRPLTGWRPFFCILQGYLFPSSERGRGRHSSVPCYHSLRTHLLSAYSVPSNKSGKETLKCMFARVWLFWWKQWRGSQGTPEHGAGHAFSSDYFPSFK